MTREDAERWAQGLEEVMERIGGRFGRVEPRRRAQVYLRGLLSPIERKNGWQLAEVAGDRPPDGVQDVLAWSVWRRRHQQRARRCHWKRRTYSDEARL
jgi:SRSO17 transposase